METFSALLTLCTGNSPFTGELPAQRPVRRSFGVFFDLRLNKWLCKQSWGWWSETPSCPLWRHYNGTLDSMRHFYATSTKRLKSTKYQRFIRSLCSDLNCWFCFVNIDLILKCITMKICIRIKYLKSWTHYIMFSLYYLPSIQRW